LLYSYTIFHSPNAYLGTVLLRRGIADLPRVKLVRRPIYVRRERGVMIAELLGGKENWNAGSYNREDCRRWSERHGITMSYPDASVFYERAKRWAVSPFHREELPARAFYAAGADKRDRFDQALFEAAWVEGLDVNEPATIIWAAKRARARSRAPDDGTGRSPPGRAGSDRACGVRAAAMSPRAYRRRQRPALLREGPDRLAR
jgi:2-hydroxychromene-2-carboxylate isomerase